MARKNKNASNDIVVKRESTKRSNAIIAREVLDGRFGRNWEYNVRRAGYNVRAVKILVESVTKHD